MIALALPSDPVSLMGAHFRITSESRGLENASLPGKDNVSLERRHHMGRTRSAGNPVTTFLSSSRKASLFIDQSGLNLAQP